MMQKPNLPKHHLEIEIAQRNSVPPFPSDTVDMNIVYLHRDDT